MTENNSSFCEEVVKFFTNNRKDLYSRLGKSDKSGKNHFKISSTKWDYQDNNFTIHFEGDSSSVKVHFETFEYIPYSKLSEELREYMDSKKEIIIKLLENMRINDENISRKKIRSNAVLTVASFDINCSDVDSYCVSLNHLINTLYTCLTNVIPQLFKD